MPRLPLLQTRRLTLRPFTAADVDRLHRLWTDPGMRRYLWDNEVISRERAESVVLASIESAERTGVGMWCVESTESGALAGFCGFRYIDDTPEIEILFGFTRAHCHLRLTGEAVRLALAYGFRANLFDRVWGRTDDPNLGSAALLEYLGMRLEKHTFIGTLPTLCYSLTRQE